MRPDVRTELEHDLTMARERDVLHPPPPAPPTDVGAHGHRRTRHESGQRRSRKPLPPDRERGSERQLPAWANLQDAGRLERPRRVRAPPRTDESALADERYGHADPGGNDHDPTAREQLEVDAGTPAAGATAEACDGLA